MLLVMSKIVFQAVALSLEGIVVLVLHLPAGATGQDNLCHGVIGNGVVGGEGIFVGHLAVRTADG